MVAVCVKYFVRSQVSYFENMLLFSGRATFQARQPSPSYSLSTRILSVDNLIPQAREPLVFNGVSSYPKGAQ
jgi:hypothetical protein